MTPASPEILFTIPDMHPLPLVPLGTTATHAPMRPARPETTMLTCNTCHELDWGANSTHAKKRQANKEGGSTVAEIQHLHGD